MRVPGSPRVHSSAVPARMDGSAVHRVCFRVSLKTTNEAAYNVTCKTVSCLPRALGDLLTSWAGPECALLNNKTASLS